VRAADPSSVIHIILSGGKPVQPEGAPAIHPMPAFADHFDDREIAELASFVRRSWGNDAPPVTPRSVQRERAQIGAAK
jgi:alcohol dehydrogenase (quinone), cytochrome c subunit